MNASEDLVDGALAVGRMGNVADVPQRGVWHSQTQCVQHGQAADARIEDTDAVVG